MKDQYQILEVKAQSLLVKNLRTGEVLSTPKSNATKAKRKNQGQLIEEYLKEFPNAKNKEVLAYLNLKNPAYVSVMRKIIMGKK